MTKKHVVLVDADDNEIGTEEKQKAHKEGRLHRAFSVFVFNDKGEYLLQQRAKTKYHSGGKWTNTCCGHNRQGEPIADAARRGLNEEMGMDCALRPVFQYTYKVKLDNGLTEHEFLHVFFGKSNENPDPNPEEADDWRWISTEDLEKDLLAHPDRYTPWFKLSLERIYTLLKKE